MLGLGPDTCEMFLGGLLSIFTLCSISQGQDLGVPLSWRKFNNSRGRDERIQIAQNAINAILPQLDTGTGQFNGIGFWQSGNVWTVLANQDHLVGNTVNQQNVVTYLNKAFQLNSNYDPFGFNDDAMWWATAAVYAYRAYGSSDLLSHAVSVWNRVSVFQITPSQASSGSNPNKSFSLASTCEGKTMAGAVFWRSTSDDQSINSITTGLFLALSSYLAEISPSNTQYKNAAIAAANWMKSLQISSENIILDSINGHDCSRSPSNWIFTYNSGKFIEGLSILSDVTQDSSWNSLMVSILASAVKSSHWEGSDGIITEGANTSSNDDGVGFKAIFVRGLHEAFERNGNNRDLQILIHSYLDVQYNALLDLAANGSTYSAAWHGPPGPFTTWGQMAALDVMTANIDTNSP